MESFSLLVCENCSGIFKRHKMGGNSICRCKCRSTCRCRWCICISSHHNPSGILCISLTFLFQHFEHNRKGLPLIGEKNTLSTIFSYNIFRQFFKNSILNICTFELPTSVHLVFAMIFQSSGCLYLSLINSKRSYLTPESA